MKRKIDFSKECFKNWIQQLCNKACDDFRAWSKGILPTASNMKFRVPTATTSFHAVLEREDYSFRVHVCCCLFVAFKNVMKKYLSRTYSCDMKTFEKHPFYQHMNPGPFYRTNGRIMLLGTCYSDQVCMCNRRRQCHQTWCTAVLHNLIM